MTQHNCLNSKCLGIRIYQGFEVTDNGDLMEQYECTVCHERTAAETLVMLDDEDTVEFEALHDEGESE